MTVTGTEQRVYGKVVAMHTFRQLQVEYDLYIESGASPDQNEIRIRTPGIRFVSYGIPRYADCGFFSDIDSPNNIYLFFCHSGGGVGQCFKKDWVVPRTTWHHVKEIYNGIDHTYTINVNDAHIHTMDMDIDVKYITGGYFSNGDIGQHRFGFNWRVKNLVMKDLTNNRTIFTHYFPGTSLDMNVWEIYENKSPLILPTISNGNCIFTSSTYTAIKMKEQFILVSK